MEPNLRSVPMSSPSNPVRLGRRPIALVALLAATLACSNLLPTPPATRRPPTATVEVNQPGDADATATRGVPTRAAAASATPDTSQPDDAEATATLEPIELGDVDATETPEAEQPQVPDGVRACDFVPGVSVPAVMPPEVGHEPPVTRPAPGAVPTNTLVDADVT